MNKKKNYKKILYLEKKIKKYSFYYFNLNKNLISNEEYDYLLRKLQIFKKRYQKKKYTQNINMLLNNKFKKKKHNIPMLSIKSIFSIIELKKYINIINKKFDSQKFCCELKIDGIAISLIYIKNKLKYALTKGNNIYGENVLNNIKKIQNIPKYLNIKINFEYLEIRGEIFISKKNFLILNKKNKNNKKKIFSNTRNLVSGSIKQINNENIKERNLSFIGYDIILNKKNRLICLNQFKSLYFIKKLGFNISRYTKIYSTLNEIINFFKKINKIRNHIFYPIDGIVIKINNKKIQEKINSNKNYVKWAIALKFTPKSKITKLKNINFQIGKYGTIIPIAIIDKINISGVNISKINLYNLNFLKKLSLSINDKLLIVRSGDVIPKISKIIKSNKENKILIPKNCPSCNIKINFKNKIPKCNSNLKCPEQLINKIKTLTSKEGFNITGIGPKLIKLLIKYKYIIHITDIFYLKIEQLIKIPKIKYKLAKKIINSINKSLKNIKLHNIIYSLSIPNIGKHTCYILSKNFKTLKKFALCTLNDLQKIKKLNKKKINNIVQYLKCFTNLKLIKKLLIILTIN